MKPTLFFLLVVLAHPVAAEQTTAIRSAPLTPAPSARSSTLFRTLTPQQSGIDFVNPIDTKHPLKRIYLGAFACGGVAIGDLNGDQRADIFLTGGARPNRLYLQSSETPLRFEDATKVAGISAIDVWSSGATLVDIDADGDLDIHVCNYDAPNQLWLNDGKGRFADRAKELGLAISDASLMASFCDYDLDGDLDCFLLTRDFKRAGGRPKEHPIIKDGDGYKIAPGFEKFYAVKSHGSGRLVYVNAGREDYLLRNDGANQSGTIRFTDVSKAAGISGRDRGNSATWWDFDEDGLPDLYVGNDFKDADRLYHNKGDGTFVDVIRQVAPHTPWFSMGADIADLDGDGRTDLLIADMAGTNHYRSKTTMGEIGSIRPFLLSAVPRQYMHNVLYLNTGVGKLADMAYLAGLASSDWTWAVKLSDFDLDGRVDVFFTNGVSRSFNNSDDQRTMEDYIGKTEWEYYESRPPRKEQNLAYANRGDLKFEDVSKAWGLDHVGMSYAAATGDLDADGDLDLVVASLDEPVRIYRNDADANRAVVRLAGAGKNTTGLGATVAVKSRKLLQVRDLRPATGFLSCNAPELVFGLGESNRIDELVVKWPSGHVQRFNDISAGQVHTVREPSTPSPGRRKPTRPRPLFAPLSSPSLRAIVHKEQPFDDFERQPLLPYKHSQLGPGMAWADIDADGDADLFLGGASGQAGRVFRNQGRGQFTENPGAFADHTASEDMGALFFDADRDGDPDLYVVSGGVECEPSHATLQDRLYLNDGGGAFATAPDGVLPDQRNSGSCVAASDYDRDGDLDLFVGGRVIPGAYPETPSSTLLRNESEAAKPRFVDVTAEVPGLEKVGLVTGALWSDANGDGWIDLLICCEWGPVRLFLNREGKLVEATEGAGLSKYLGWWNGIAGADLDGDGDIDYVATNAGLNTPYKATVEAPELLYYGDVGGTGTKHIIEAKFENGVCYPRRGFSCSSGAIKGLRARLKTFHNYAMSSLSELYTDTLLEGAERFEANTLQTCVLINNGSAKFVMTPLPRAAQQSPSHGVALSDFDADGHIDCVLAQNFFGAQPETGLLDAGLGHYLKGRGDGTFEPIGPSKSGIIVPGAGTAVTSADLNGDARPEIVFATNSGPMQVFSDPGAALAANKILEVRLAGKAGNSRAIGARVEVRLAEEDRSQTAELAAGSGYLGQSEPALWFGLGSVSATAPVEIEVKWPDGTTSTKKTTAGIRSAVIRK